MPATLSGVETRLWISFAEGQSEVATEPVGPPLSVVSGWKTRAARATYPALRPEEVVEDLHRALGAEDFVGEAGCAAFNGRLFSEIEQER